MVQFDPKNHCRVIQWVDPDAYASATDIATVDSPVDTIGWRYAMVIVNVGTSAGVLPIQVEASATTGGTYADVTGALISVSATDDDARYLGVLDLQGGAANMNRWLQLNGTEDGTGAIDMGVTLILFNPVNTVEYIDYSSGGADELTFDV